jgi:DNA-binding NtrC family response regulator
MTNGGIMNERAASILIVEDEPDSAAYMRAALRERYAEVRIAGCATEALLAIESRPPDLLILDLHLPDIGGLELLTMTRQRWPPTRMVCVTAADDIPTVVDAVQRGASNYLVKPVAPAALLAAAAKALSAVEPAPGTSDPDAREIVGSTLEMIKVRHLVVLAGRSDVNVLITGETGTGKELVARAIHRISGHPPESFLAFNCATTPADLFDSEFFGHRRGAFTGADRDHAGLLLRAEGRTLLLDELESLGAQNQAKLLRVLDDGEVRPVGSSDVHHVSLRFLAATNRDPAGQIRQGLLREDLYYRLRGFAIDLPPLRERAGDIPALAARFLGDAAARLTDEAVAALERHAWPGNVRELRNALRSGHLLAGDGPIRPQHLRLHGDRGDRSAPSPASPTPQALATTLRDLERGAIFEALRVSRGHRGRAARALGIDRSTLRRKIHELEARPPAEPR